MNIRVDKFMRYKKEFKNCIYCEICLNEFAIGDVIDENWDAIPICKKCFNDENYRREHDL